MKTNDQYYFFSIQKRPYFFWKFSKDSSSTALNVSNEPLIFIEALFDSLKKEPLESHDNFPLTQRRKNAYEIYERVPDHN